jgi:hypothetical protein
VTCSYAKLLATVDRQEQSDLLSMDALKFCNEKYLVCGSDSPGGKPAIVQIWDIDALANLATFPAHDTVREMFLFAVLGIIWIMLMRVYC